MSADLVRVETPVRWAGEPPPTHPGRALNAWFYGCLARRDERLASELHERPGAKPFTLALVSPRDAGEPLRLVVTGCGPLAGHAQAIGTAVERLALDGRWLERAGEPSVRIEGWGELASRWLIATPGGRAASVRLEFLTPTAFHSRGRTLPLPVPELVFGGLLQRWQAWASIDLGEAALVVLAEHAALRRHRLWTVMTQMEGKQTGCLGWAEFVLVKAQPAYSGLLALLGAFGEFAGVGQKTTMGFGCVLAAFPASAPARPSRKEVSHEPASGP